MDSLKKPAGEPFDICINSVPVARGEVIMVSRWQDRAAFREFMKSSDHRTSHDRIDPLLRRAVTLERLENLHTYEVVAP